MHLNYFTENILPLKDRLFRFAWCIVRNKEEAEDVVQEVLLKVWNGKQDMAAVNNVAAYCTTLTKNMALDRLRHKSFRTQSFRAELHETVDMHTPSATMEETERTQWLEKTMARLPKNKRMLIQLRDIEGESYQRIAEMLGVTESQVKSNLFRIRQELKQEAEKRFN